MKQFVLFLLAMIAFAACQPSDQSAETPVLPTLVEFPTDTPTNTDTPTATMTDTLAPVPSRTPSNTPTETFTPSITFTPSNTPPDTPTATVTANPTRAAVASATAALLEAPTLATFTPAPPDANARPTATGTPQVIANVIITERQFQEEINRVIADMPNVNRAEADITPDGIVISLTSTGSDGAFTTGEVVILIQTEAGPTGEGGVAVIRAALLIDENAPDPSEDFIAFATGEFTLEMVNALDFILKQRLGESQNLEAITLTDDAMLIKLLVPKPGN